MAHGRPPLPCWNTQRWQKNAWSGSIFHLGADILRAPWGARVLKILCSWSPSWWALVDGVDHVDHLAAWPCLTSSCSVSLLFMFFSRSKNHCQSLPITARSVRHFGGAGWCVMNFMSFWAAIHLHKWLWSCSMQTSSLKPWVPPCKMRYSTCPKVIQETKRKIYKAINKCIQNILNQQISKAITEILEQFNIHSTMKLPFAYTGVCRGGASVALLHVKPCPRSGRRAMQWRQSCHELPLKQYRLDGNAIESCRCSSCC